MKILNSLISGELYPIEVYKQIFIISILSGDHGIHVFSSENFNFPKVIKENETEPSSLHNTTKDLNDFANSASKLAFYWNVTHHTEKMMTV